MTENPHPPFFDRAWWQAFTSNSLGSAVGTGLVTLVVAAIGVATGIIQSPGTVQLITNVVLGTVLLGGFVPIICIAVLARSAFRKRRLAVWLLVAFAVSSGWTVWVVIMLVEYQHSRGL